MNETLKQLFDEDQADRNNNPNPTFEEFQEIANKDKLRRNKADRLLAEDEFTDPEDYYYASFIYQHGTEIQDYLKANELAKKAMDLGYEKAKWIYAATTDRYLSALGKPQKYGTQYRNSWGGDDEWVLYEVDPNTTDEERIALGLKPLAEIPKKKPRVKN
jgi:hypothetical protein